MSDDLCQALRAATPVKDETRTDIDRLMEMLKKQAKNEEIEVDVQLTRMKNAAATKEQSDKAESERKWLPPNEVDLA